MNNCLKKIEKENYKKGKSKMLKKKENGIKTCQTLCFTTKHNTV